MYKRIPENILFYIFLIVFLFCIPGYARSANPVFYFDHIKVEDGLHNSIIYNILQDKEGIIWFGLHDGVDKYNGYDFKHYDLKPEADSSFDFHSPANSVCTVSDDEFVIGSGSNLYIYDRSIDNFRVLIRNLKDGNRVINQINSIYLSSDSLFYLGTNLGIFVYDRSENKYSFLKECPYNILSFHAVNDYLWIGSGEGIHFYDLKAHRFAGNYLAGFHDFFSNLDALTFYTHEFKKFTLIGTRSKGLFYFDHQEEKVKEIQWQGMTFPHIRIIKKYHNTFLIGTDGAGLIILDLDFKPVAQYELDEDKKTSLSSNAIYDIHIDPHQRLWVSTYGGGVNIYDPNRKPFHIIRHEPNNEQSLRNNGSRSILEVDGDMWFGTTRGISILKRDGHWVHIPKRSDHVPPVVLSLCRDSYGRIWSGTFSNGVAIRDPQGKLLKRLNTRSTPSLTTDYIYTIFEDKRQNIWLGGIRGGLMRIGNDPDSPQVFPEIQNVHAIIETSKGEIMIGTLNGIFLIKPEAGKYILPDEDFFSPETRKIRVFSIAESPEGNFWIGTEGSGLINYNRNDSLVKVYSVEDGLSSAIVYGILLDKEQKLWLSTTAGISRFDPETEKISNFSFSDGLSGKDFNYGAFYKTADEKMYFGSSDGITWFEPELIGENTLLPNIVFTRIAVYGKDISNPENPFLNQNINEVETLVLEHNQSSFTIDFAAINYTGTRKNLYQWRMKEKDKVINDWTPVSTDRRAVFSYLPPGDYEFTVKASNNDGYWNTEGKSLHIIVNPPFWNTLLAKIIYILLGILIFIALQRYIITLVKNRQAGEKIKFFINVAHDIRTPLTLIRAPLSKLSAHTRLSQEEREEIRLAIRNSERLNNLVNQLIDFQKASLNKYSLKVAEYDIVKICKEILNSFQPLMEKRIIVARLETEYKELMVWIDRQKVEKVLYNLVSNAIKYSYECGEITVKIESDDKVLKVSVTDKGRGIPLKQQKDIFKRYFRAQNAVNSRETGSGVGLMLSKKLMKIHNGDLYFSSEEHKGSKFWLEVPARKNFYKINEILSSQSRETESETLPYVEDFSFSRNYTLLVVEDNPELRHYLRDELKPRFNVITAKNGKEAYHIVQKMDIDLIVSDVMMPEMDGKELCLNIRRNIATSHIPIILLTALNSLQYKIEGLDYGADDYIEKPFDILYLKVKISNILKARERIRKKILDTPHEQSEEEISHKPDQELMKTLHDIVSTKISHEDFTVKQLCELMGMSRPVLYRKLKAYTGHSPQEYLLILRLNHASALIRKGHMTIKEIAYSSGFSDPKYFSKCFKKHYGVSPSSYLKAG